VSIPAPEGGSTTAARYNLVADDIVIHAGSDIASDVYYNTLANEGTITGIMTKGLGTLPGYPSSPLAISPGTVAFDVPNGETLPLGPGPYGDVTVQPGATLIVHEGTYGLGSLLIKSGGSLVFDGPVELHIRYGFAADNSTFVGPANGLSTTAADLRIYSSATDKESRFNYAVSISPKSALSANINAPKGTIWLNQGTRVTGAFAAQDILISNDVQVRLATAFQGLVYAPASTPSAGIAEQLADEMQVPTSFELGQNYPNPFNPSTTIRYGLPRQSRVILTVHNMLGEEVARLVDGEQPEGYYQVQWNGRSSNGAAVSTGVYFYRLSTNDFTDVKKMILLK